MGALSFALAWYVGRSILAPLQRMERTMNDVAGSHDLTCRMPNDAPTEIASMARSFNTMIQGFQNLVRDISSSSQAVEAAARQLSGASSSVARSGLRRRRRTARCA